MQATAFEVKNGDETLVGWVTQDEPELNKMLRTVQERMERMTPPGMRGRQSARTSLSEKGFPVMVQTVAPEHYRIEDITAIEKKPVRGGPVRHAQGLREDHGARCHAECPGQGRTLKRRTVRRLRAHRTSADRSVPSACGGANRVSPFRRLLTRARRCAQGMLGPILPVSGGDRRPATRAPRAAALPYNAPRGSLLRRDRRRGRALMSALAICNGARHRPCTTAC